MGVQLQSVGDLYRIYRTAQEQSRAGDESYNPAANGPGYMSEAEFRSLPESQQMQLASQYTTGGTNVFQDADGNLVGYGDPRFIGQGGWFDPQGLTRGDNGRFTINRNAVNWGALDQLQQATDSSGYFSGGTLENILRGAGIVLGVGGLANSGFLDFLPGMDGAGAGFDLGATGGLSPEEAAMGGHFTPGPGYMGDPYSLDPGFFDAGGNAIGGEGLGIGGGLDPETIALNTPGSGPPPGYMGDPYSLDPGFFDANGVATGIPGGTSLLDRLISAGPPLLQALSGITQMLGGGQQGGGGGGGAGRGAAGLGGMASALPGGKMAGPVEVARNPYAKPPPAPNVLDLLSYVRGAR